MNEEDEIEASRDRFAQWFDCFTILFDVSSVDLMEEFENLNAMVEPEMGTVDLYHIYGINQVHWVNRLLLRNDRTSQKSQYFR